MVRYFSKDNKFFKKILAIGFLLGLILIAYIYHPSTNITIMGCPFREITGIYCAGCGSVRATIQILNGNFIKALSHNVFAVLFFPVFIGFIISVISFIVRGKFIKTPDIPARAVWILLVLLLIFTIARNIDIPYLRILAP